MLRRRDVGPLALLVLFLPCVAAQIGAGQPNDAQPHVVLVSFDGFRHDYATLYNARNLLKLQASGATASGLTPVFPSMTFSSHYTLVTGVYSDRHGIVDNTFYDPETAEQYHFLKQGTDGKWYKRPPLWVTAEQQGLRTATFAWPGSQAAIDGVRPTFSREYSAKGTNDDQTEQALEWLRLPSAKRPRLIVLYFDLADAVGHKAGPDGEEMRAAVQELDRVIGRLQEGIQRLPLRVNLIIVADHGMMPIDGRLALRDFTDLTGVRVVQGGGALVHLYCPDPQVREKLYRDLKGKSPAFEVYRRAETPSHWHYSRDARIGDLVVVATGPKVLDGRPAELKAGVPFPSNKGGHGYDAHRFQQMNGVFIASGPNIKPGQTLRAFDTIHVYPLIAKILDLKTPSKIDGKFSVLRSIYRP